MFDLPSTTSITVFIEISTITLALVKNQCTEAVAGAKERAEQRNREQLAIGWSRSRVEGWERAERMSVMCCGRLTAFVIVRRSFVKFPKGVQARQ